MLLLPLPDLGLRWLSIGVPRPVETQRKELGHMDSDSLYLWVSRANLRAKSRGRPPPWRRRPLSTEGTSAFWHTWNAPGDEAAAWKARCTDSLEAPAPARCIIESILQRGACVQFFSFQLTLVQWSRKSRAWKISAYTVMCLVSIFRSARLSATRGFQGNFECDHNHEFITQSNINVIYNG